MASERRRAKDDVDASLAPISEPPELTSILSSAHAFKHELATRKEENRHAEIMRDKEIAAAAEEQERSLGTFGRFFGGSANAPIAIASLAVVAGLAAALYCFHAAAYSPHPEAWFHEAEWAGALAATSLSFIFGRAGRR